MRKPNNNLKLIQNRRELLKQKMLKNAAQTKPSGENPALILFANPEYIRNNDVHYEYRQDSNFYYLTGFEEPESIFIFRPGLKPETILFVRPKDELRETWDGFRYGPEAAAKEFQIDECYLIEEFEKKAAELLKPVGQIYHHWQLSQKTDQQLLEILQNVRLSHGRSGRGMLAILDSRELIGELRLFKSAEDIEVMRRATSITAEAHCEIMRFAKPGMNEKQLHGVFLGTMNLLGAQREGYGAIVATGANATTLHYVFNDQECKNGDLVLVDAGAEYQYFGGDITRCFPINGKFTDAQKRIYEAVLDVQKKIIGEIRPGMIFQDLQKICIEMLTDVMIELKLLKGSRADLIEKQEFKKYYMHGVSHYLGMDVHDAGLYLFKDQKRTLEEGMCFTVEPGIYVPQNDELAPAEFRGIGIRIEDNILITKDSYENLTVRAPKEVVEIETLMQEEPKYFREWK